MIVYNQAIRDPASPTSFVRSSLVLDDVAGTYELTVQVLADNPRERDWRAEFTTVAGRYERADDRFTFHVETGSTAVCSSAWRGRGVEPFAPFPSFTGVLDGDAITVAYLGELVLTRSEGRAHATAKLVIPDYEFT